MKNDPVETPFLPSDSEADLRRRMAIRALDAGLRELERQGAVVLPRYCDWCGTMNHPPSDRACRKCGL